MNMGKASWDKLGLGRPYKYIILLMTGFFCNELLVQRAKFKTSHAKKTLAIFPYRTYRCVFIYVMSIYI